MMGTNKHKIIQEDKFISRFEVLERIREMLWCLVLKSSCLGRLKVGNLIMLPYKIPYKISQTLR